MEFIETTGRVKEMPATRFDKLDPDIVFADYEACFPPEKCPMTRHEFDEKWAKARMKEIAESRLKIEDAQ